MLNVRHGPVASTSTNQPRLLNYETNYLGRGCCPVSFSVSGCPGLHHPPPDPKQPRLTAVSKRPSGWRQRKACREPVGEESDRPPPPAVTPPGTFQPERPFPYSSRTHSNSCIPDVNNRPSVALVSTVPFAVCNGAGGKRKSTR